jgi:hypothetical protein
MSMSIDSPGSSMRCRLVNEQPKPSDGAWSWNAPLWKHCKRPPVIFGSLRVSRGVCEYCPQCGEMIFAQELACAVIVCASGKWVRLHFHKHCYVAWERIEVDSAELELIRRPDQLLPM